MVLFRPARPEELPEQKQLWQLAFGDDKAYVDRFFRLCGPWSQSMVLEEEGRLRGATQLLPVTLTGADGTRRRCAYVYAVCIHPESQGRGLGRAMASYADFYLQEKGFDCAVTVPATPALHRFYALQGFGECFRTREYRVEEGTLPGPLAGDIARRCGGEEYGALRERLLEGKLHVSYPKPLLDYQRALGEGEGGGLFALEADGTCGCACVELLPGGGAVVKELLLPRSLEARGLAALESLLGPRPWTVRVPGGDGGRFGMLRWYRNETAFSWDWVNTWGYLGLAFD